MQNPKVNDSWDLGSFSSIGMEIHDLCVVTIPTDIILLILVKVWAMRVLELHSYFLEFLVMKVMKTGRLIRIPIQKFKLRVSLPRANNYENAISFNYLINSISILKMLKNT